MYGWGHNEELLGRCPQGRRGQAVLTTSRSGPERGRQGQSRGRESAHVQRACDASLKRLGCRRDRSLLPASRPPNVPIEETVGAMSRLVEQGKARYLGLSEAASATIRRAHAVHAFSRGAEASTPSSTAIRRKRCSPTVASSASPTSAYSPLGRGFWRGTSRIRATFRPMTGGVSIDGSRTRTFDHNLALIDRIEQIGEGEGRPARSARPWRGSWPRKRHPADPGTQASLLSRRKPWRAVDRAPRQRPRAHQRGDAAGAAGGHALSGTTDERRPARKSGRARRRVELARSAPKDAREAYSLYVEPCGRGRQRSRWAPIVALATGESRWPSDVS